MVKDLNVKLTLSEETKIGSAIEIKKKRARSFLEEAIRERERDSVVGKWIRIDMMKKMRVYL